MSRPFHRSWCLVPTVVVAALIASGCPVAGDGTAPSPDTIADTSHDTAPACAPDASGGSLSIASDSYAATLAGLVGSASRTQTVSGPGGTVTVNGKFNLVAKGCEKPLPAGSPYGTGTYTPNATLGGRTDPGAYDVTQGYLEGGVTLNPNTFSVSDAELSPDMSGWIAGYNVGAGCIPSCGSGTITIASYDGTTLAGSYSVEAEEVKSMARTGQKRTFQGTFSFTFR